MKRAIVVLAVVLTAACSPQRPDELTVFAAASLTEAFTEIGDAFEEHHGTAVTFNFAASSLLSQHIGEGAEADVFASADPAQIDTLGSAVGAARTFVRNRLAIAVPKDNPERIGSLADLAGEDTIVVLCAAEVPCGRYADDALDKARVTLTPVSREENVKAVLTKVTLGEADAGIVYESDLASTENADEVAIPDRHNVIAEYRVAVVEETDQDGLAAAFVDFVLSEEGRATLERFGFETA
ncbi:MAG: molybdate ABC transporter substrate-binding protein [Actinomycetota bacterium]